jgi:hypothetical protein
LYDAIRLGTITINRAIHLFLWLSYINGVEGVQLCDDFESKWTKVMTRKEGQAKRKGI